MSPLIHGYMTTKPKFTEYFRFKNWPWDCNFNRGIFNNKAESMNKKFNCFEFLDGKD